MANHVHRATRLGAWVLISEGWYNPANAGEDGDQAQLATPRQGTRSAAASSGEADFGFFGRGVWIDMPQAFNASQPRWTATRSSPSSRAMKAATLALVHKPPSFGGSFKRTRSLSRTSGFNTLAVAPLRRRQIAEDSGPSAL